MSKKAAHDSAVTETVVIGRKSAETFSAIEGQFHTARTSRLLAQSDADNETGEQRRARIRAAFSGKN